MDKKEEGRMVKEVERVKERRGGISGISVFRGRGGGEKNFK